jgi:NAD(P)-dependent dehydrogenase (short-subunit alcohol dehydrogenase family)
MTNRQTVFVTGASSGIGRATALELARRGHRVLIGARRNAVLDEIAQVDPNLTPVPIDVTDSASIEAAALRIDGLTDGHGVDVLVNSAGYALAGPVEALSSEAIEHQFATNVFGLLAVTRAILPRMRERRSGRVINVSSVIGRFALPGLGVYSASKHAVEALSDALRIEVAPFGVSVVLIEPSWVATDIAAGSLQQTQDYPVAVDGYEELFAKTGGYIADQMAHNSITPEQVARQIATAAEAPRPKARYVLPAKGKVLVKLLETLPDRTADRAKRRTMGLAQRSA